MIDRNYDIKNNNINDIYIAHSFVEEDPISVQWKARAYFAANYFDLKFLKIEKEKMSEQDFNEFNETIRKSYQLNHASIIKFIELGEYEKNLFIATSHQPAQSLNSFLLEKKKIDWSLSAQIILKLAQAIRFSHNNKIYHNHINSHSIMLEQTPETGEIKVFITNFGFDVLLKYISLKNQSDFLSYYGFFAPENLGQKNGEDPALNDIYGLGVLLYQMITGKYPFIASNQTELKKKIDASQLTIPIEKIANIPSPLGELIGNMLQPQLEKRETELNKIIQSLDSILKLGEQSNKNNSYTPQEIKKSKIEQSSLDQIDSSHEEQNLSIEINEIEQIEEIEPSDQSGPLNPLTKTGPIQKIQKFKKIFIKEKKLIKKISKFYREALYSRGNICLLTSDQTIKLDLLLKKAQPLLENKKKIIIYMTQETIQTRPEKKLKEIILEIYLNQLTSFKNQSMVSQKINDLYQKYPFDLNDYYDLISAWIKVKKKKKKRSSGQTGQNELDLILDLCSAKLPTYVLIEDLETYSQADIESIFKLAKVVKDKPLLIICTYDKKQFNLELFLDKNQAT